MNEQVEKFDPSKLMDGVKQRIKATFVALIPDDQWETMVQKEIDAFFEPTKVIYSHETRNVWGSPKGMVSGEIQQSAFQAMVWDIVKEKAVKHIHQRIDELWGRDYQPTEESIDPKLKEILAEAIPLGISNYFKSISMGMMMQLKEQIRNNHF